MKINFLQPVANLVKRAPRAPAEGKAVGLESSDRFYNAYSGSLTPEKLSVIFRGAESGDVRDLHVIGAAIAEKNWSIWHSLQTRANAVNGTPWEIVPGSDSAAGKSGAELFKNQLLNCGGEKYEDKTTESFDGLLEFLSGSAYLGAAASEIIWGPGGEIRGFSSIPVGNITFPKWDIRLNGNTGEIEMPEAKFVTILRSSISGDPSRAGLVRTLAWLHVFMSVTFKDLLGFIERCGMPFVVANVSQKAWNEDRDKILKLIENFGSHGGGVFSDSVKLNMMQAANSGGNVYFTLLNYVDAAITKVILGQTASSSDGGGLSGDDAQSKVRRDITESDCKAIANAVNTCVSAPWARFNLPANEPAPRFRFISETKEEAPIKDKAEVVRILFESGFEFEEKEVSETFGFTLKKKALPQESSAGSATQKSGFSDLPGASDSEKTDTLKAWSSELLKKIAEAADDESGEKIKSLGDAADIGLLDTGALQGLIENTVYAAAANGAASKVAELSKKIQGENNK